MICPDCQEDLVYIDYYGPIKYSEHYYLYPRSWIEKAGNIYECNNEDCESCDEYFYTDSSGELYEGYPC